MICYGYDSYTGAYAGEVQAEESPLEPGVWHYPANTTSIAPPTFSLKQIPVFKDGAWTITADHRGERWWTAEGEDVLITTPGDPNAMDLFITNPKPRDPVPVPPPAPGLPAPDPNAVPETVSERQFMMQLASDGDITWAECIAFLSNGTLPKLFADAFAQIPTDTDPNAQYKAIAAFVGAKTFDRHNPETLLLQPLLGKTDAQLDDLWRNANKII